jgi:hypothetical protein
MFTKWRLSSHAKRHCARIDRYYARCQKVANGHHSEFPYAKRYEWLIKHDY